MKKKLLVFHPIIGPYRIDYFNALAEHYDLKMCLMQRNLVEQPFEYEKIAALFNFTPVYIVRSELGTLRWLIELWKSINREKPDLVYVWEYGFDTILTLLHRYLTRGKYKIICGTDDSYNMLAEDNHFTRRHSKAINLLAPRVDEIINVEPRSAEWYQKRYDKGIYFPIICDDATARNRQLRTLSISEQYVRQYGLQGKRVFLFVGRLVALKNIAFALKAFIKANIKDSVFVIVGSGEEAENLKTLAKGHDNIKLVGRFEGDALYAWYNVAQVFTLPSYQEPFGAVTNEALVAGCKCLISKDAGSNCLIENGKNGYIIDPKNEETFVEKINLLMNDANPIQLPLQLKPNQMMTTFKEHMDKLIVQIDQTTSLMRGGVIHDLISSCIYSHYKLKLKKQNDLGLFDYCLPYLGVNPSLSFSL